MSLFRLSNHIFELGLDAQELSVYAYLCSLPASGFTLQGSNIVTVKQRTIAANCGIRSPVTVAKTIDQLREKGLVDYLEWQYKANGHRGTYWYAVIKHPTDNGFFMVDRHVFGMLVPRQMLVYLFLCKSFSTVLHDCWNSYNDIAAQIGMKRESVIHRRFGNWWSSDRSSGCNANQRRIGVCMWTTTIRSCGLKSGVSMQRCLKCGKTLII